MVILVYTQCMFNCNIMVIDIQKMNVSVHHHHYTSKFTVCIIAHTFISGLIYICSFLKNASSAIAGGWIMLWSWRLSKKKRNRHVGGFVEPGFERVAETFKLSFIIPTYRIKHCSLLVIRCEM